MDAALIADLQDYYDLSESPFGARTGAFYEGAQRKHNLEVLRHMAIFGDMVLLLTGEHGAGKSALLARFVKDYTNEVNVIMLGADSGAQQMSSLERLAALSGLSVGTKLAPQDLLEQLIDHFSEQYQRDNKRVLIVIDDAHTLSDPELNALLRVMGALDPESGVALLLSGPPSLTQVIAQFKHPARDEWFHQIQLKPLSKSEIEEYLLCLLQAVGYSEAELLSEAQLTQLSESTNGLPGAINALFPLVALNKIVPGNATKASRQAGAKSALLLISMLLLVVFATLLWFFGIVSLETEQAASSSQGGLSVDEAKVNQDAKAERLARIESAMQSVDADKAQVEPEPANNASILKASEANEALASKPLERKSLVTEAEPSNSDVSTATQAELVEEGEATVNLDRALDIKVPAEPKEQVASEESVKPEKPAVLVKEEPEATQHVPSPPSTKSERGLYRSKSWLLSQPDNNFSAQVLGSYSESTAKKFAQKLLSIKAQHRQQVVYVKTRYKGKPWFVVLYGQHPDKLKAQEAVKISPAIVTKQRPWVRSFAGIKSSL